MVSLLKNKNLLDKKLIKLIIYWLILVKAVKINIFIDLIVDVFMILNLQNMEKNEEVVHQFIKLMDTWNWNLYSMDWINKWRLQETMVLFNMK